MLAHHTACQFAAEGCSGLDGALPCAADGEMMAQMRHEALHIAETYRGKNHQAVINLISDGITALGIFVQLLRDSEG